MPRFTATFVVLACATGVFVGTAWQSSAAGQQRSDPQATRRVVRPDRFPNTGLPYSPAVLAGDTLYLSGQLGRDPDTARLVSGGIGAETRQALVNLGEVLKAAGMDYRNVVSVTVFISDFKDFQTFNTVYREFFPTDPPARATVQVAGLNLGAAVEIQMIAVR